MMPRERPHGSDKVSIYREKLINRYSEEVTLLWKGCTSTHSVASFALSFL